MGPYKPLRTWVDEFIPYYMEISWEFRPDRTNGLGIKWLSLGVITSLLIGVITYPITGFWAHQIQRVRMDVPGPGSVLDQR